MAHELNEPQAEAALHVEGPLLVFAGAGSGKTRVITYRIANLVATHGVPPYRILAVTFTNKAAGEMRERLRHLLGEAVAKDLWVGTFHATCAKLLRRHHEAVGLGRDFVIYDDADQRSVVNRIVKDLKLDDKRYPPRMLLSIIHAHKQEGRGPDDMDVDGWVDEAASRVFRAYEQHLRGANACDFDDLLLHVLRLVELPDPDMGDELAFPPPEPDPAREAGAAIRRSFRQVLVDEFQDTNGVQYRLVRALVRDHGNLCVVGDDDQSIYSWRGADVRNIRGFERDFPGAHVVRLEQNYRSTKRIVRGALGVISPSKERVPKDLWTDNDEGEPIAIRSCVDERDEAAQVVSTLKAWLAEGWTRREMAILYRVHAQSRVLEEAMRAARLPYRIVGGLKFYDRAEIKDLLAYLRLVVNPKSDVDLARVINVPARGIGDTTVERVAAAAQSHGVTLLEAVSWIVDGEVDTPIAAAARKKLGAFRAIVDDLQARAADGMIPSELAAFALERTGYLSMLEAEGTSEAETRAQNLAELLGSIRDYEAVARAEGDTPSIAGFLEKTALVNVGDEKTDDAVTLMTVHGAKGLEYRGVIITGLEDEMFPYKGARARDDDGAIRGAEDDDLEEERRLAYVAVTRARQRLVLLHAAQRTIFGQTRYGRPSRFLRDLPQQDVVHFGARAQAITPRGWGEEPRARFGTWSSSAGREPFRHPQASASDRHAPGERYVERFEDDRHAEPAREPARSSSPAREGRWVEREDGGDVHRGTRVRHKKFGDGRVVDVLGGPDPKVIAEFPGWGRMTILQRFVEIVD